MSILQEIKIDNGYDLIVVDPPWPIKKTQRRSRPNQIEMDYPLMTIEEIRSMPIESIASGNSVLFLWTIQAHLKVAFDVMAGWGFKYQRCLTWDKGNGICTHGFHHRTEFILYGYRGKTELFKSGKAIPTVFKAKSERHSAKPDEFYEMVKHLGERRVDIFARKPREGYAIWGNEV